MKYHVIKFSELDTIPFQTDDVNWFNSDRDDIHGIWFEEHIKVFEHYINVTRPTSVGRHWRNHNFGDMFRWAFGNFDNHFGYTVQNKWAFVSEDECIEFKLRWWV